MNKVTKLVSAAALMSALLFNTAQADHKKGSTAALAFETSNLSYFVENSWLRYSVKNSVKRFERDVDYLSQCVRYSSVNNIVLDHTEDEGVPRICEYNLRMAYDSFRSVDRYLYDTEWDLPNVFRAYLEVKDALYDIRIR